MLSTIAKNDLEALRELVSESVRRSIGCSDEETAVLIGEVVRSLDNWSKAGSPGFGRKYSVDGKIVGFVVVRDYCALTHLFVCPEFQSRGIGRALAEAAVAACRDRSHVQKIELNSSSNAARFYEALGFHQTGPGINRPGGCVPYEYSF